MLWVNQLDLTSTPVRGRGDVKQDLPRAIDRLQRACEYGNKHGCYVAGTTLAIGNEEHGIKNDAKVAEKLLKKSCDLELEKGCAFLGQEFLTGRHGFPKDLPQARKYFDLACDKYDYRACYNLAAMYGRGDGVKQDPVKAAYYYEKFQEASKLATGKK